MYDHPGWLKRITFDMSELKVLLEVMKMFDQQVLQYHFSLEPPYRLPHGVEWLMPYNDPETRKCMQAFYRRFYHDSHPRTFILGINPGRFGAGITGVPFTDPIRLAHLGISNVFPKKQELSSVFIYAMIEACGGPELFFSRFYITSLSPLGFVKDGKNYNYYDHPDLAKRVTPFIVDNVNTQLAFGSNREVVFCLGQGKNFEFLQKLNQKHKWWERVVPLPHPRWVMQYRLKDKARYIEEYKMAFSD